MSRYLPSVKVLAVAHALLGGASQREAAEKCRVNRVAVKRVDTLLATNDPALVRLLGRRSVYLQRVRGCEQCADGKGSGACCIRGGLAHEVLLLGLVRHTALMLAKGESRVAVEG